MWQAFLLLYCKIVGHPMLDGWWVWDGQGWQCTSKCTRCGLSVTGPVRGYGLAPGE